MRPRQACLGILCAQNIIRPANERSFNEAEASLPRNPRRCSHVKLTYATLQ